MELVNYFRKLRTTTLSLVFALVSLSGAVSAGDEGCVTCHVGPMALNTLMPQKNANHPDVGAMVSTVPTDCVMCHAKETEMALMTVVHAKHEGIPCDGCHVVDAESGMPTSIKSGAKNW